MGLYRQLAGIERILKGERIVEPGSWKDAHDCATNIRVAAQELVKVAGKFGLEYGNADCALHAKNLAENLHLYLRYHGATGEPGVRNLSPNEDILCLPSGEPVGIRFRRTHKKDGLVTAIRNSHAHGSYKGYTLPNGFHTFNDRGWKRGIARDYLAMAEDCLLAVHEAPQRPSFFEGFGTMVGVHSGKIGYAGLAVLLLGSFSFFAVRTEIMRYGAQNRVLRNQLFLAYAQNAQETAAATPAEPLKPVGIKELGLLAIHQSSELNRLAYQCSKTEDDFRKWLEKNRYADFATHDCLEFWATRDVLGHSAVDGVLIPR